MDYAFAPGPTPFDVEMGHLLDNRPTTDLLPRSLLSVHAFIEQLDTLSSVTKPVESMFIASHAHPSGQLKINLVATQKGDFADFETLEAAVTSRTIRIPASLRTNPDGTPFPATRVRIRGCRVGSAAPFMDKLKEAFGGIVSVSAPKHFHVIWPLFHPNEFEGMFEWLAYSFSVHSKTPLTQAQVQKAMRDSEFEFWDGTKVPDAKWTTWVPAKPYKSAKFGMNLTLGTTIGPKNVKLIKTSDGRRWRYGKPGFFGANVPLPAKPSTRADGIAKLRAPLQAQDYMKDDHPFPVWARYGYDDYDDFFDNVNWTWTWDPGAGKLRATASRHEYTAILPITTRTAAKPDNGNLIFNYFPDAAAAASFISLRDDDPTLFHVA